MIFINFSSILLKVVSYKFSVDLIALKSNSA
jgi:hypothetical protein